LRTLIPMFAIEFRSAHEMGYVMNTRKFELNSVLRLGIALALVLLVALAPAIRAADAPASSGSAVFSMLPDDTLVVIVVPKLSDLDTKFVKLGAPLKVPVPSLLTETKQALGIKEGLNESGTAVFAMVDSGEDKSHENSGIGFLPVSDYAKFIEP